MRSTAATHMVNSGASKNQLMEKFGWKNETMATEYTRKSTVFQKQVANMMAGTSNQDSEVTYTDAGIKGEFPKKIAIII